MSFNQQKKLISRQLLFLFAFLLACLISACGPSPLTSAPTSTSTSQAGAQNACSTSANSIYTVQGQILYTALSVYEHTPQPGENIHTIPHRISLVAFNINNGQKLWSSTLAENVPYFPNIIHIVGVINHTIYVDAGILIAADARDGHALWQHKGNVDFGTYICAGILYQINEEGQIIALQSSDGTLLWSSPTLLHSLDASFAFTNTGIALIDRSSGASADHTALLTVLNPQNGHLLWTHTYPASYPDKPAFLAADSQTLYIINSPALIALDPVTGKMLHTWNIPDGRYAGTILDHTLYLYGSDILAVDTRNGKQLWENSDTSTYAGGRPPFFAALSSQDLYTFDLTLNGTGRFCALNSGSGKGRWCVDDPGQGLMRAGSEFLAVSDTAVLILVLPCSSAPCSRLDLATIYALNKKDGSVLWSTPYDGVLSY